MCALLVLSVLSLFCDALAPGQKLDETKPAVDGENTVDNMEKEMQAAMTQRRMMKRPAGKLLKKKPVSKNDWATFDEEQSDVDDNADDEGHADTDAAEAEGDKSNATQAKGKKGDARKAKGEKSDATKAKGKKGDETKAKRRKSDATKAKDKKGDATKAKGKKSDATTAKGTRKKDDATTKGTHPLAHAM